MSIDVDVLDSWRMEHLRMERREADKRLFHIVSDNDPQTQAYAALFRERVGARVEREILIALQCGGRDMLGLDVVAVWESIAAQIKAAPSTWRWWIRRHPAWVLLRSWDRPSTHAPRADEDAGLTSLQPPTVILQDPGFPLSVVLPHMDVLVSLSSKTSLEAAAFGVPAFLLHDERARILFPDLIEQGRAKVIDPAQLNTEITRLTVRESVARIEPPKDCSTSADVLLADSRIQGEGT